MELEALIEIELILQEGNLDVELSYVEVEAFNLEFSMSGKSGQIYMIGKRLKFCDLAKGALRTHIGSLDWTREVLDESDELLEAEFDRWFDRWKKVGR